MPGKFQSRSGWKIEIKVCFKKWNHDPVENLKSGFDSSGSTLQSQSWWWRKVFNQGLVEKLKSKSARKFPITIRLRIWNQGLIELPEEVHVRRCHSGGISKSILSSRSGWKIKIKICLKIWNRDPFENFKSEFDCSGSTFQSRSWSRWKVCNQGPVEKSKSKSARKFSITIRSRISNQGSIVFF